MKADNLFPTCPRCGSDWNTPINLGFGWLDCLSFNKCGMRIWYDEKEEYATFDELSIRIENITIRWEFPPDAASQCWVDTHKQKKPWISMPILPFDISIERIERLLLLK